ncbi:hypothetical protein GX586_09590 [bacterium]|nr:hypothetical protein [bacterium]
MHTKRLIVLSAVFAACGATRLFAATQEWQTPPVSNILQLVADGKGGCVVASSDTNERVRVTWYDRKGAVMYESPEMLGYGPLSIINSCSSKQLLYTMYYGLPMLVQVSRNGSALPVASIGGYTIGGPIAVFPASRFADAKGFFVINVDTNIPAKRAVRYSYK